MKDKGYIITSNFRENGKETVHAILDHEVLSKDHFISTTLSINSGTSG